MILPAAIAGAILLAGIVMVVAYFRPAPEKAPKRAKTQATLAQRWRRVSRPTRTRLLIGAAVGLVAALFTGIPLLLVVIPAAIVGLPLLLEGEPVRLLHNELERRLRRVLQLDRRLGEDAHDPLAFLGDAEGLREVGRGRRGGRRGLPRGERGGDRPALVADDHGNDR